MKFDEFLELNDLKIDDILLVQQTASKAIYKIKLSTLAAFFNTTAGTLTYSVEAEAVINAIQNTGTTLTLAQKNACNKRIADMKDTGIWDKRIAYYGFLGGTPNAHAINWKSPGTYNISWVGGMVHSSNGINSDGSTGYGNTGLTESLFNPASTHISVYSRSTEANGAFRDVGNRSNDSFQLIIAFGGFSYYRSFATTTNLEAITPPSKIGYFVATRNNSNAAIYRNGIMYASTNSASGTSTLSGDISVCAVSNNYTTKIFGSVGLGQGLTQSEIVNDYNSEQAYQTRLNRQV